MSQASEHVLLSMTNAMLFYTSKDRSDIALHTNIVGCVRRQDSLPPQIRVDAKDGSLHCL